MDEDLHVILNICRLIAVVIVCGIGSCSVSKWNTMDKWDRAVTNGADPMVVSCSLNMISTAEAIVCNTLAQNRK